MTYDMQEFVQKLRYKLTCFKWCRHIVMHVHYCNEFFLRYTSKCQRLQKEEAFENTLHFMGILLRRGIQLCSLIVYSLTGNHKDVIEVWFAASASHTRLLTFCSDFPSTLNAIIIFSSQILCHGICLGFMLSRPWFSQLLRRLGLLL
jgi:hypothetical protein